MIKPTCIWILLAYVNKLIKLRKKPAPFIECYWNIRAQEHETADRAHESTVLKLKARRLYNVMRIGPLCFDLSIAPYHLNKMSYFRYNPGFQICIHRRLRLPSFGRIVNPSRAVNSSLVSDRSSDSDFQSSFSTSNLRNPVGKSI